ncbi:anti-sigma factor [Arthrobacter sp.]|uniref:anti-sigma factor n=1 Tax=Arthrobacter sp. TaxID=1667 RepID=UPI0028114222|nr:anti-sigma factor [Arthrobacter sp.]
MTENNNDRDPMNFSGDIATDLAAGHAAELAELYALDALSDEERAAVERHIAAATPEDRQAFNDRVRQARETLALSFSAEEEPASDLFGRIVAQLPSQQAAPVRDALAAARQRREERRRSGSMRNWIIGVAAAAALALGGVGIGAYNAYQNDPLNQVLQAQDLRKASVGVTGGGTANLAISPSKNALVVTMDGVPAPPEGKVYQMWLIPKDGSAPVSKGLMDAEALSKPAVVDGIQTAASLGITVEPLGGSGAPSTPPVAAATLGA